MKYHKLYADAEGESHWEEVAIALAEQTFAPPAKAIEISEPEPVQKMLFLRLKAGWHEPVHTSPVEQKLICLTGSVDVTASDGETRSIGPGEVWHMADGHGTGHRTVVTSAENFTCVIVQY